jgi:hypothetical protein
VARTATDLGDVAAAARALGRTASAIPADLTAVSRVVKIVEHPKPLDDTPDLRPANKH